MPLAASTQFTSANTGALAVKKKDSPGPYVAPTQATDFMAMQADFNVVPNDTQEDNLQLTGSLIPGPSIPTGQAPTGSFSHYWKGSGTEGTAPEFGPLLDSALGAHRRVSTERTTTAGSTVSEIKCANAQDYSVGDAVLVKDDTNGWSARPIKSVSGTTLGLAFDIDHAPAAGTKLGKCTTYYPLESKQPLYDITHLYDGGKGGMEYVKDCRTSSFTITANPSTGTNCAYNFAGAAHDQNPSALIKDVYFIDGQSNKFRITSGANETAVTIPINEYLPTSTTASETLANALQTAIRAVSGQNSITTAGYTVAYSAVSKKYTFTKGGSDSTIGLDFTDQVGSLKKYLGFTADTVTGAATITAPNASAPDRSAKIFRVKPAYDQTTPPGGVSQWLMIGATSGENVYLDASTLSVAFTNTLENVTSIARPKGLLSTHIGGRSVEFSLTVPLEPYQDKFFNDFKNVTKLNCAYVWGRKTGGNWDAGNSGVVYSPTCTISAYAPAKAGSIYTANITVRAFSDGVNLPIFYSFL